MSEIVQKIGGREFILLSYPFSSTWRGERFEDRCLELGGIIQSARVDNINPKIVTINALLPVDSIDEFKRLEAENDADTTSIFSTPKNIIVILFASILIIIVAALFLAEWLGIGL